MNLHFDPFVIPFTLGMLYLFGVIIYRYIKWFFELPLNSRYRFGKKIFSYRTITAAWECVQECLFHRSIWKRNPLLGYMHTSLALGWFLLIVVGKFETSAYLKDAINPPYLHVFFRFFYPDESFRFHHGFNYAFLMDILLIFVLSGVALALFKRFRSRALGMRKTTKHTTGDRIALSVLWLIFPARLLAESITCGLYQLDPLPTALGNFMTHGIGSSMREAIGLNALSLMELPAWWIYSLALGIFFVAMPYSRYMHIFTEIPYIFLKNYGIRSQQEPTSMDNFEIQACSRCGICIDPCQLQSAAGINNVQSVYFLRDRRYNKLQDEITDNCLMCGRCETKCPVHLDLMKLRQNSRTAREGALTDNRFAYLNGADRSEGRGKVGYFAGCMTLLQPGVLESMRKIFEASGDEVWWADREGGVCCGRPLKLSGEVQAARRLMDFNIQLFQKHGIETLVTSCPICLRVFKEDYDLPGIEVLHHSQYILRRIEEARLTVTGTDMQVAYHDPCELGRGLKIYKEPRRLLSKVAFVQKFKESKKNALCCGGSLGDTRLSAPQENAIATTAAQVYASKQADLLVTACPQCKDSFKRNSPIPVKDLSELIAERLVVPKHDIPKIYGAGTAHQRARSAG
ncbi:MAG: (Fe-S)-binding protein [Rikenellaceae bacterium]|jgi:Fe-S oxidoreductase|nr:(Fe-S)-binding protein [Rikenellaceae bacterium]